MSFEFIHIPKTAGNYIYTLFGKQWRGHLPLTKQIVDQSIPVMAIIREPIDFYTSLYYFFKYDQHVNNYMKHIARMLEIDEFIYTIIDGHRLEQYCKDHHIHINVEYDQPHMKQHTYGLLSSYLFYFLNPYQYTLFTDVVDFISNHIELLRFEQLDHDLDQFIQQYTIQYHVKHLHTKVNCSQRPSDIYLKQETIDMIYTYEQSIYQYFYPETSNHQST